MEAAQQNPKDQKEWRALELNEFYEAIFAWPCVLSDCPSCSGGYQLERGRMPLHVAVGINCKMGSTTKNQGTDVNYMG